jgi:hypothetical protein
MDLLVLTAAALGRGLVQGIGRAVASVGEDDDDDEPAERRYFGTIRESTSDLWPDSSVDRPANPGGPSAYSFNEQWKELLVYTEAGGTYTFLCGWGNFQRPYSVGVPTAETWDRAMPEFMHGRRDEILGRLRKWAGASYTIDEYVPPHLQPDPE